MSLDIVIRDGLGSGKAAKVNGEGEISVVMHTHPPIDEERVGLPFRQYMTDDGTSAGSNDMIVDGSTTPQSFFVKAEQDFDIYIKAISLRIGDAGAVALDKFGALTALTNGCDLFYRNDAQGELIIADTLDTNLSLIRLGTATGSVGTGTDAYLLDVSGGGTENTYLPFINFTDIFGFPWGVRIKKGTNDIISFRINDNLAGLVTFNAIAYGTKI